MTNLSNMNKHLTAALDVLAALLKLLGEATWQMFQLLTGKADSTSNNKSTENTAQGGVLNYRTGQFDDGTDASGWYEKD